MQVEGAEVGSAHHGCITGHCRAPISCGRCGAAHAAPGQLHVAPRSEAACLAQRHGWGMRARVPEAGVWGLHRAWMLGMSGTQNCESVGCDARCARSSVHAICDGSAQVGAVTLKNTEKDG